MNLEELLQRDPSLRRCLRALIGDRDATLDDLTTCYAEPSKLREAIVASAITEGRIPHTQRDSWTRRLSESPKLALEVLADLEPRRDLAEAAWWSRQGDALYAELDAIIDGPGDRPGKFAEAEGDDLYEQWERWWK